MNAVMKIEHDGAEAPELSGVLTAKQSAFVSQFVALGGQQGKAAELAGYADAAASAHRLVRLPHIQAAIRAEQARLVLEGGAKGLQWMVKALDDAKLPGAVRFQSAKWLAEAAGHGLAAQRAQLGLPASDKPLSDMTLDELDAFIAAGKRGVEHMKAQAAEQAQKTIEGQVVRSDARSTGGTDA